MQNIENLLENLFQNYEHLVPPLNYLQKECHTLLNNTENLESLQKIKNQILDIIKKNLSSLKYEIHQEKKKHKSIILNTLKQIVFDIYHIQAETFKNLEKNFIEGKIFFPSNNKIGELHPLTITTNKIYHIMYNLMKFDWQEAKEIDRPENIFDKLNMPPLHPARDDQQSFFLKNHQEIPRTQCTNFQTQILKNWNQEDSLRYFHFGNVYRCDSDATHTPKFQQFEIFFLDEKFANLPTLMGFWDDFFQLFFGFQVEKRIRTSYFPFTGISYEVDIMLNNKWLEIGGCGMVHTNVFKFNNKKFTNAWAIGMGIERLTMIIGAYKDIRKFYQNDIRYY